MNISYRPADRESEEELHFLADVDSRIPIQYDASYPWNEEFVAMRKEFFKKDWAPDDFFWVAIDQKRIVGFHFVKKGEKTNGGAIITLWVDEGYRGQGIAGTLKRMAEEWAREQNLSHLETSVHGPNTRMLEINRRNGFEIAKYVLVKKL